MEFYNPRDFFPDDGSFEKLYPILPEKKETTLVFDNKIQRISHIQGNIVAVFENWFLSFFENNYFKHIRLKTESSFSAFKSFMKGIYKKDKPILVIDINSIDHVDDSIFGLNMINRYNMVDPRYDAWSSKLLYSIGLFNTNNAEIRFRRNRYRFSFDVLIMEDSMDRQLNTYNSLMMNIRHRSKFTLVRNVLNLIPLEHIHNIAIFHNFKTYKSDEFLDFMNSHSAYPIVRRILPNGQWMFYMRQEIHLYVDVPDIPGKDSPEMSAAFEYGAQVRDSFVIEADIPSEFIFITSDNRAKFYVKGKDPDPESVYYVPANIAWPDPPTMHGDYKLVKNLVVAVDNVDDNNMDIMDDVIKFMDTNVYNIITGYIKNGYSIKDIVYIHVNGQKSKTIIDQPFSMDDKGIMTLIDPSFRNIYQVLIYVNFKIINAIQDGNYKEYIGTIEKY